jgi:hypothetical protein
VHKHKKELCVVFSPTFVKFINSLMKYFTNVTHAWKFSVWNLTPNVT